MIIEIDHIAFASKDPEAEMNWFLERGYTLAFYERSLPNLEIKRPLMRQYCERQDLALLTSKTNVSVELVRHDSVANTQAAYMPVQIEHHTPKDFVFTACSVQSTDLQASDAFWALFGFQIRESSENTHRLVYESAFQKKFSLVVEKGDGRATFLDDSGYPCLAFISNNAAEERKRFASVGIRVTEIQKTTINKKTLEIFFAIGPQHEMVEIIGIIS